MINDDLQSRVRAERKRRGWTQKQVAAKAGISERAYQMFENRESQPQGENLRAILAAVEVSPESDDVARATRSEWPQHRKVFLDMLGAYLGTMPEGRELEVIHDLTRQIFERNRRANNNGDRS